MDPNSEFRKVSPNKRENVETKKRINAQKLKEKEGIYAKCVECGSTPEKIYIDSDGIQVSYEAKLLNDIKELMYQLDQRICNLEVKLQDLEGSQGILEESLAYINRYLVEKN